ncbi:LOW QUALITY PROTEIN: vitamin D3 hydroxylase-associated protein-like [Aquarana catesbeiana]|uniref:LOW QUALITY PROTEIN: vitamin D3 hydroxylase-associated protein-like n=1 Tax=Aquarana catesbeiana TaxID=8400 RepID=UPI003CCA2468
MSSIQQIATMKDTLAHVLSERSLECKLLATLGCLFAASVYGLRWRKRIHILRRMEEERERREDSVRLMQEALRRFLQQNPGLDHRRILDLTLVELAEELKDGTLSPETALYVYVKKALEVHKSLNCVTVFLSDCEAQLKKLQENGVKGPLYGVPVSIKEHVGYQGHPYTCGLAQYLDVLEEEDSVIVKVLKKQGAIVFAKTNVPQSLICFETSNTIYGHTKNPHNTAKGASGSSGGEGALIGGGGSVLGFGTDLTGSIRLPSSFCGIAGFKPTSLRLSMSGVRPCIDGMTAVPLCIGPMAQDVDGLVLVMKALLCDEMFNLDPNVPPIYFNEELYSSHKPLRIGYYEEDGFFLPSPGMRRVLLETKQLLGEAGHQLIPFKPPRVDYAFQMFLKTTIFGDGGKTLADKFKENIVDIHLAESASQFNFPALLTKTYSFLLQHSAPRISKIIHSLAGPRSIQEHWMDHVALQEYQAEFIREWKKLNLDAIICPMLSPAFNIGYPGKLLAAISYTMLYNMLQFPAGVVPVGFVTKEDEKALRHYTGYNNDHWDKCFKKAVADGVGLPLSVQCVALPYQDELCLRLMKEVQTLHVRQMKK